jgi:leucyl-tRNA synthetase
VWRLAADWMDVIGGAKPYGGDPDALDGDIRDLNKKVHQTIQKVTADIEERYRFNTAISAVMELVNAMYSFNLRSSGQNVPAVCRFAMETLTLLLSPFVPHFSEQLWAELGKAGGVYKESWPTYREDALEKDELLIVVQVNGKLRSRFSIGTDADDELIKETALANERIQSFIEGKTIRKVIVVKKKLVNIVV